MAPAGSDPPGPRPGEAEPRAGILLRVAYDGTRFSGFAPQPGQRTVAGALLDAVRRLDASVEAVRGSSRTDAGVHALDHPVAFDASGRVPLRGWLLGTRRWLPDTVVVRDATAVALGYNPRFDAVSKTYRYLVQCGPTRDPFLADRAWPLGPLEPQALAAVAATELESALGRHRFDAFRSAHDTRRDTTRTMEATSAALLDSEEHRGGPGRVVALEVTGSGFLHHMVRILVGTAVDVARGRLPAGAVARALASGRRQDAGITAPACGLYLATVRLRSA